MSRNKHFKSIDAARAEVSGALNDMGNTSRNIAYMIHCDNDRSDFEFEAVATRMFDEEIPSWAWAAHYADYCLYVGATTDLHNRFLEHCFSADRGALFTGLFPPKRIVATSQFGKPGEAFTAESPLAAKAEEGFRDKYDVDETDEVFVYQA